MVIGIVETHGRAETDELLAGLRRLPRRASSIAGGSCTSSTSTPRSRAGRAAGPRRRARAHQRARLRHPKRWQDVQELLDAGVDVWTTMNVQHLESLNDIVSGITGVRVRETVPERFRRADEVVVVDLPPDELLAAPAEGKVYMPQQAERAAKNFFRKGNLLALRELALRRTADRVDDEMQAYRRSTADRRRCGPRARRCWLASARGERGEKAGARTARLAAQLDGRGTRCTSRPRAAARCRRRAPAVLRVLKLAQELGADDRHALRRPSAAPRWSRYAREHNLSPVVLGRDTAPAGAAAGAAAGRSVAARAGARRDPGRAVRPRAGRRRRAARNAAASRSDAARPPALAGLRLAPLCARPRCGAAAGRRARADQHRDAVPARCGRRRAALRARPGGAGGFLGVAAFDFFFVPPRFTSRSATRSTW